MRERVESPAMGDAAVRILRGLVCRAAEGDTEALEQLQRLEAEVPAHLGWAVAASRVGRPHYSWTLIGKVLGITRQAASQRFHQVPVPDLSAARCGRTSWTAAGTDWHQARCRDCKRAAS